MTSLLLLSLLAIEPRPAQELFASCTRSVDHGSSVFDCRGVVVHAAEEKMTLAKVVKELRASWERKTGVKNLVVTQPFPMEGKSLDAQHVVATVNGQPMSFAQWVVFSEVPGVTRVLGCTALDEQTQQTRCPGLLASLVVADSAFLNLKPDITFAGKPKVIPSNCSLSGGMGKDYQLACGKNGSGFTFATARGPEDAQQILEKLVDHFSSNLPGAKRGPAEQCKVGGTPTTCLVVKHEDFTLRGATWTGAEGSGVVTCTQHPSVKGFMPVCSDVFAPAKK